jgi:prolyl 4-hydroxylase
MNHKILAPAVVEYEFPEELAKNIINIIDESKSIPWEKSGVGNEGIQEQEIRTSSGFNFSQVLPFWDEEVKKHFIPSIQHYCKMFETTVNADEGFGLLKYEQTNKYDFHSDADWNIYRTVSALVYLNPSEYEGGATHFKNFDIKVKPERPSIVVFPSNYAYLHAAMPVTEGCKFVLVTWMNDLPQGFGPNVMYDLAKITGRL